MMFFLTKIDDDNVNEWILTNRKNAKNKFTNKFLIFVFKSYEKAIKNFKWKKFSFETIQIELTIFITNETWKTMITFKNVNIVINKWIFKAKMHINKFFDKLKIRLMTNNFFQICDVNYSDTFASTIKFDILRFFMMIVTMNNFECHQIDVNNAFIKFFFKKKIYMKSSSNVNIASKQILIIKRNLYDFKQIANNWHEKCIKILFKLNFVQIFADSCLLRHFEKNIVLLIYVNDMNIAIKSMKQMNWFKKKFEKIFKIKNLKKMNKIFDIKIIRDRQNQIFRIN